MAHSHAPNAAAFIVPPPPSRIASLHPLAALALEELLLFYTHRKVSEQELEGSSKLGVLELVHIWVMHGNAVDVLNTYEKYLTAVGELVHVFDGRLTDLLIPEQRRATGTFAELLFRFAPPPPQLTLHRAVQRETYDDAQSRRHLSIALT